MSEFDLYEYIRESYMGSTAYADALPESLLKKIHIATRLDKAISSAIGKGHSIVLTGNPGDGKTHLLRILRDKIQKSNRNAVIELDASEKSNEELISAWKKASKKGVPYCAAINEAVLYELASANSRFEPVVNAQRQVEDAIVYRSRDAPNERAKKNGVVVFDLSHRNVLAANIVVAVLSKFANAKFPPEAAGIFEIDEHASLMKESLFQERLQVLFERISRRRYHCTVRELQGLVGYLLGKGLNPNDLAETSGNAENFLSELVYSGKGHLFSKLRMGFDPAQTCHPIWDTRLVANDIRDKSWQPESVTLVQSTEVDDSEEVERRRRRFFFFNKEGDAYLKIADDIDSQFAALFESKSDRDVLRDLIPKINRAFCFEHGSEEIRIWESHRYDHSTQRMLYSTHAVKRRDFEVLFPRLSPAMSVAFDYVPDHIVIQVVNTPSTRITIDFFMYEFLCSTDFGGSVIGASSPLTRRLWQFMERLAITSPADADEIDAKILDAQTGELLEIVIDTQESKYLSVESAS